MNVGGVTDYFLKGENMIYCIEGKQIFKKIPLKSWTQLFDRVLVLNIFKCLLRFQVLPVDFEKNLKQKK